MEPAPKKVKVTQRFKVEYSKKWPFIVKSHKGESFAYCSFCKADISIKASGAYDITRHVETPKHHQAAKDATTTKSLFTFASKPCQQDEKQLAVTRAEVIMTELITELNLPISAADTLTKAFKAMFPDSEIAKNFACGRTKSTAIIKDLSKAHQGTLLSRMKISPFTLSTDGSNDCGDGKQFPIVIRTFDENRKEVLSELLAVPVLHGSGTGEAIFAVLDRVLQANKVPWSNCIGFGCDNAPVMTGQKKGVYSFINNKNDAVALMGCSLHLVHLAAEKAADSLPASASDLLVDIFFYLKRSSLRKHKLGEFQFFHDVDQEAILKHVPTRWLSIGRCLDRLLKNWDPLKSFFRCEVSEQQARSDTKVHRILQRLRSPSTKLYMLFLQHATSLFQGFLTEFQAEEPKVHVLRKGILNLMTRVLVCFIRPSAMGSKQPFEVEYKIEANVKTSDDILIGEAARSFIEDRTNNNLSVERIKEFYPAVVMYFTKVMDYLIHRLPYREPLLCHMEVCDLSRRMEDGMSAKLRALLDRFPCVTEQCTRDDVLHQFALLQCSDLEIDHSSRVDHAWSKLLSSEYRDLARVMLKVLTLPHSSAHCERIFSCVRRNLTEFRSSLEEETLEAILVTKLVPGSCLDKDRQHNAGVLKHLKGSCMRALSK